MDRLPWFPFYGRDFFGDETVKSFNLRQIGMYTYLLWHQWEHGSIPSIDTCFKFPLVMASHCQEWEKSFPTSATPTTIILDELAQVHACFKPHQTDNTRYINARLELIRDEQVKKHETFQVRGRKGGIASAQVKLGSSIQTQTQTQTQNQIQNQKEIKKEMKTKTKKKIIKIPGTVLDSVPKVNGIETWEAYRFAYKNRYGVDPVRNQTVNSQLCQLVRKLGVGESPNVAAFYVTHNSQWYVTKGHPVNLLVADAEKLRTEWATNTQVTSSQARQVDGRSARAQMWNEIIEESKHKEGKA